LNNAYFFKLTLDHQLTIILFSLIHNNIQSAKILLS